MTINPLKSLTFSLKALILGLNLVGCSVFAQAITLPPNLIPFNSTEGEKLLIESTARDDYVPLSIHFVTQKNQAYCGVASMVMVLNALEIPAPEAKEYSPYHMFTQDNFFDNEKTQKVKSPEIISRQGMTLDELGGLLESYGVKTKVYHASDTNIQEFRQIIADNLQETGNFVILNYLRKSIGQEKGGHISPIAAYNKETDRFLILDVSRYKYPPVWVKAEELWQAIATVDSDGGKTRGFVIVSP